ncbi:MAG: YajQ family cyclic di-GMP-binding protein [Acidimicrobiia bacterium]
MPTFDVVSSVDTQELRNAVDQTNRELSTRYDFRGTGAHAELGDDTVTVEADSEGRVEAANDVLASKLVRRGIDLRSLDAGEPQTIGGGRIRVVWTVAQGIDRDAAKDLVKIVKDLGLKVQAQVQGDQLRVTGKKRDDLQSVIAELKALDFRLPLQFENFRD